MSCSKITSLLRRLALVSAIALASAVGALASGGHGGLPVPTVELAASETTVPFILPEGFPIPVVEVTVNGTGPWRLAVDTAMGGTVLLRQDVARQLELPVVGQAMVGDSSTAELKPADLVRIEEMTLGGLSVHGIVGLGFTAGNAHLSEVPDDLHGILGNQIYTDLLTTIDYPQRELTFRYGSLDEDAPFSMTYIDEGKVMVIEIDVAGAMQSVIVDSGHRGTITLESSHEASLPLAGSRALENISTVTATYERKASRLDGTVVLAETRLIDPEIVLAEEPTPQLLGYGVLEHFAVTIDQRAKRIQFTAAIEGPITEIGVTR